jgi:hypothetical protein
VIPRRPLRGKQKKSTIFEFLSLMVDLTVQCFDVDLSSNNDLERFVGRSSTFHGDN